jgi:hypothetical protein
LSDPGVVVLAEDDAFWLGLPDGDELVDSAGVLVALPELWDAGPAFELAEVAP